MREKIENYLPLARSYFKNELWREKREYSKAEAWLDMVQMARYTPGTTTVTVRGKRIKYGRGEFTASIRHLRGAWGWGGNDRVKRFLNYLKMEDMISTDSSQGQTVITLKNFPKYNPEYPAAPTAKQSTPDPTPSQPKPDQPKTPPDPKTQSREITKTLVDYWNEINGTRFRSIKERIPQVHNRLKTFSADELKQAIYNRGKNEWTQKNEQHANWDALFRSDKQVEQWLARPPENKSGQKSPNKTRLLTESQARQHAEQSRREFTASLYQPVQKNGETFYIPPD